MLRLLPILLIVTMAGCGLFGKPQSETKVTPGQSNISSDEERHGPMESTLKITKTAKTQPSERKVYRIIVLQPTTRP